MTANVLTRSRSEQWVIDRLADGIETVMRRCGSTDVGGENIEIDGSDVHAAPLSQRVTVAGRAWVCLLIGTKWDRHHLAPRITFEIQPMPF